MWLGKENGDFKGNKKGVLRSSDGKKQHSPKLENLSWAQGMRDQGTAELGCLVCLMEKPGKSFQWATVNRWEGCRHRGFPHQASFGEAV